MSPLQRRKAWNDISGISDQVHFNSPDRLKAMADICTLAFVSTMALLPFYVLFNVDASVIAIILLSSLISTLPVSISTEANRQHLLMIVLTQSSILALAALLAQDPKTRLTTIPKLGRVKYSFIDPAVKLSNWLMMNKIAVISTLALGVLSATARGRRFISITSHTIQVIIDSESDLWF